MKKTCFCALFLFFATSFAQSHLLASDIYYGYGASETGLNNVVGMSVAIYPFSNSFGFSIGAEYSSKERKRENAILEGSQEYTDNENDPFVFKYRFHNHEEIRSASALQIPILLRYTQNTYYASAGLKIGIPQTTEQKTSYSALYVEGYYPELDCVFDDLAFQGYGNKGADSFTSKFSSDLLFVLAFEYGAVFEITNNTALMMGVFVERSINDGIDKNSLSRIERHENGNAASSQVNKMAGWKTWNPWAIGIQFKFSFMR